uniref:acylsugar acyltransferase 3-like n=1 Tax=Erigeron canadensis TaxID=72917 RepID=UPI001CB9B845|nr:acylsugar acyltransferase 3-like [Erigeron canadensis]
MKTITDQETIKPSSPTPPHLNRYNLSFIECKMPNIHLPVIFFYENNTKNHDVINNLKKSLSNCLTKYYPFAGRLPSPSPASYVECNDEGVEFLEASIDLPLQEFVLKRDPDDTVVNKLAPDLGIESNRLLEVQVNHFSCGGFAVGVSLSHKVADGSSVANFVNYWATVTRGGSPIDPTFISYPVRDLDNNNNQGGRSHDDRMKSQSKDKYSTKRFVFSNSKLNDLKNKINNMNVTPLNPSRVESLASLLFKCAVNAATTKTGSFKPSKLSLTINMREKVISTASLNNVVGNVVNLAVAKMATDDIQLNEVITSLRKDRMEMQGGIIKDVDENGEMFIKRKMGLVLDQSHRTYTCTSLCNSPIYKVDFGWGKPVRVIRPTDKWDTASYLIFMDTASGDGIEATVKLIEEEMNIFQNDKEFLAFVQD